MTTTFRFSSGLLMKETYRSNKRVADHQDRGISFFGRKYYASFHGVQITLSILPRRLSEN